MQIKSLNGFTLAELLICIAILGEIAAFALPKILYAQQDSTRRAVWKEDISTIQAGIYNSYQNQGFTFNGHACYTWSTVNYYDVLATFLNYTQATRTNGQTGKFYLANGSTVSIVPGYTWTMYVDWNGDTAPNLSGDDIIPLQYNDTTCTMYGVLSNRFGVVNYDPTSLTLYNGIW